jgi:hypothetical protein
MKAQQLRSAHQLVEAREQLKACAAGACPLVVQSDCASWLTDVERSLPTVVFIAKSAANADVLDVTVSADGKPIVSKLDGLSVPINPGLHTFHFEGPGGTVADRQVLVREGEKNQAIEATLSMGPPPPPRPQPPPPEAKARGSEPERHPAADAQVPGSDHAGSASGSATDSATADASGDSRAPIPWKTIGWGLGAAGVVGLGVGLVAGIVATSDKNAAHCVKDLCDAGTISGIKSAAIVSDVGWIAGGVLLVGGVSLVLLSPSARPPAVTVTPAVGASSAGAVVAGRW